MRILTMFLMPLVFAVHLSVKANSWDASDDIKRQMVISQFRNKLIEYFRKESVLVGVGYNHKTKNRFQKNARRILNRIEGISDVPEEQGMILNKILIPGIIPKNNDPSRSEWVGFSLPNYLAMDDIHSAKFLVALKAPNNKAVKWKINIGRGNVSQNEMVSRLSFFQKTKPIQGGIHEIKHKNLFIEYFDKYWKINDGKNVKLKLTGKQAGTKRVSISTIILVLSLKKTLSRSRRNVRYKMQKVCTNSTIYCCMKTFVVTPAELNLQNILSPSSIELNYCRGECNNYSRHSNHAKYLSMLKNSKNSRLSRRQLKNMRSCCTPMNYKTLQIHYREYSQVIKKVNINDMVVTRCACN